MSGRRAGPIFPALESKRENALSRLIHSSLVRDVILVRLTLSGGIDLGTIAIGHFESGEIGRVGHRALDVASFLESGAF